MSWCPGSLVGSFEVWLGAPSVKVQWLEGEEKFLMHRVVRSRDPQRWSRGVGRRGRLLGGLGGTTDVVLESQTTCVGQDSRKWGQGCQSGP